MDKAAGLPAAEISVIIVNCGTAAPFRAHAARPAAPAEVGEAAEAGDRRTEVP
ncbi:hypothetical protein Ga0609869_003582 [Rhodovulum iodosum]|uniref:Uncharacterized protein n=1 Tax=Rhodovulum iodosum TaxID=68291 RepID=A0ABV3XY36_9RHOB|nr:hypothetical protein [Rhodovulum robiginosum]